MQFKISDLGSFAIQIPWIQIHVLDAMVSHRNAHVSWCPQLSFDEIGITFVSSPSCQPSQAEQYIFLGLRFTLGIGAMAM